MSDTALNGHVSDKVRANMFQTALGADMFQTWPWTDMFQTITKEPWPGGLHQPVMGTTCTYVSDSAKGGHVTDTALDGHVSDIVPCGNNTRPFSTQKVQDKT